MRKPSKWKHKKYTSEFVGNYERDRKGERIFVLTSPRKRIVLESNEAAKALGWKKVR